MDGALDGRMIILVTMCLLALPWITMTTEDAKRTYDGCRVLRVAADDSATLRLFEQQVPVRDHRQEILKWNFANSTLDILVHGSHIDHVTHIARNHGCRPEVLIHDVGREIFAESLPPPGPPPQAAHPPLRSRRAAGWKDSAKVVGTFARYKEIVHWMRDLAETYPDVARVHEIGTTHENREMVVLQLGVRSAAKWKVWVDGGIHAREWIAPSTVIYIAHSLIHGYLNNDPEMTSLLHQLDWYFLPVMNPDGYEYTHTTDRMWRKNRRPSNITGCRGVDLNRNWRFNWAGPGSSAHACDSFYRGPGPESEPEVKNVANFLLRRAGAVAVFVTYHSYGQRFLTRWDYSAAQIPDDHEQLVEMALRAADAISAANGALYSVGRASQIMYPYGGGSPDWARAVANIKFPYLIELPNEYSFILPQQEIVPVGRENVLAIKLLAKDAFLSFKHKKAPSTIDDLKHVGFRKRIVTAKTSRQSIAKVASFLIAENTGANLTPSSTIVLFGVYVVTFCTILTCMNRKF